MNAIRVSEAPRWRILSAVFCMLLVGGLFFTATVLAQVELAAPASPPSLSHCIETAAGEGLNCTANDVQLSLLTVNNPNALCVETPAGSGQFYATVKMQAELIATAQERYDIGMFIATDGGDARTGTCARNYLPGLDYAELANPGNPGASGLGNGPGPYYDGENSEDPTDQCGDLPQRIDFFYGLRAIDPATGRVVAGIHPANTLPGDYVDITIKCVDTNLNGTVDVGSCTSWDNQATHNCQDLFDALPNTKAKCNCGRVETTLVMPAFLTLVKHVVNDNGGTAVASDFQGYVNGGPVAWGVKQVLQPGTFTASESPVSGYTASAWSNACAENGSVTLASGDDKVCEITNDDNAPSLILKKHVINDNGGTAVASNWTLHAGANSVTGSEGGAVATNQAGTYALSESSVSGYTNTSVTCSNGDGPGSVTIGLGETVTCTFVNDDISPTLKLVKTVINDNGGTLTQADFPSFVDGNPQAWDAVVNHSAGAHTASETPQAGYSAGSWGGDCAADGSITLALAQNAVCTITNDDISPTLKLVKTVINNNGGTLTQADFPSFVDGSPQAWDAVVNRNAGAHTASETPQAGYSASAWSGDCAANGSITLALAQNAVCYITNDDIAPTLKLVKTVVNGSNPGGTKTQADFPSFVDGNPQAWDAVVANTAGAHTASETPQSDYTASAWSGDCAANGSVTLALAQNAVCYITNTAKGRVDVLKTLSGTTPPAGTTFDFQIRTGVSASAVGTTAASCTTDASGYCDFGGGVFLPGDYWFCEVNMLPGWSTSLTGYPGAIVPNNTDPGVDNSVICAPFTLDVGETESFSIDNLPPPGGDARTIGFWKNWTSCDGNGNQDPVLDQNLPIPNLGLLAVATCPVGVDILDKRDIANPTLVGDGKKKAGDAAYGLAAQLAAYELNQNAGAGTCPAAVAAAAGGHVLLLNIGFTGTGDYLKGSNPSVVQARNDANTYAGILDSYNNNELCSP